MTTTEIDVHADPRVREERTYYVGRNSEGARIFLCIRITDSDGGTTIDHEEIGATLRYSFTFERIEVGCRAISACGAGAPAALRSVVAPNKGWTIVNLRRMADLAESWHLNDMRAGCSHMPVRSGAYDVHCFDTCSAGTGYRFGRSWLIEEVPTEIVIEIEQLLSKVTER